MHDKKRLTWTDIEKDASTLISKIKGSDKSYDCIVGIANGGLIPTCLIAKALKIKKVFTVSIKAYIDEYAHQVQFVTSLNHKDFKGCQNVLIIDDLVDRGETLFETQKILSYFSYSYKYNFNFDSAVVYLKKSDDFVPKTIPTYYSQIMDPKTWLVFPWE